MIEYLRLNIEILYWLFIAPCKGERWKFEHVVSSVIRIGVQALPMSCLTAFSVGLTLAMLSAEEMTTRFGTALYVGDLVSVALMRELGPLLTAIIVIGRSGSAVTAELGTMKVSEEIEALTIMAINPVRFLIVPRFIAMMIMLPVLTVFSVYVGIFGGWIITYFAIGQATDIYILHSVEPASLIDLYSGLTKTVVFAWLVITIACHFGISVRGGAEGVGRATTNSVVFSLISMIIANALLTALFFFAF